MDSQSAPSSQSLPDLQDLFARTISYLRLSLTDRCNLRCRYCVADPATESMPQFLSHNDLLSYEELTRVVQVAVQLGIRKLRLTGGEPLVRRDLLSFIQGLSAIPQLEDIRLTTNGVLLADYAAGLLDSGVSKVNISLDSLQPKRFAEITGADCFDQVWQGIEAALAVGFSRVKLNMVVMRGVNDDELQAFARLAQARPIQVRFIEFMPIGHSSSWRRDTYMSSEEIMAQLAPLGQLEPVLGGRADGPARVFRFQGQCVGSLGFISPISHKFCAECNRLRLTAEGKLRACLLRDQEHDLRQLLRQDGTDKEIAELLLLTIRSKPQGHQLAEQLPKEGGNCHGQMSRIGG